VRLSDLKSKVSSFHKDFTDPVRDPHETLLRLGENLPDHPACLKWYMLLKHKEYRQLLTWEVDPIHFNYAYDFQITYLCASLLSKYADVDIGIDKEAVGRAKWIESELSCQGTNEIFRLRAEGGFNFLPHVEKVLLLAQRKISNVLGPLDVPYALENSGFGPGSDLGTKGLTSPFHKMEDPGHVTANCLKLLAKQGVFSWPVFEMMKTTGPLPQLKVVRHNKLMFVPKNSKTLRPISSEPRWNIFFQKGLGQLIKRKLQYDGIDTSDQTRNQQLSRRLDLATIDLSSASDRISWWLVLDLLPFDWFDTLDALRSPFTKDGNNFIELEKFSSMGNGYTFELETLIFYGLSTAVCQYLNLPLGDVSVYGDDIIVPVEAYPLLVEVLSAVGFSINLKKSYASGLFRESCGFHWFNGVSVTPFYIKEAPNNAERIIRMANQVALYSCDRRNSDFRDKAWLGAHARLVRLVPKNLRFYGPITINSCIGSDLDEYCPPRHRFFDAWVVRCPVYRSIPIQASGLALLYEKLIQPSSVGNFVNVRGRGYWTIANILVHDHQDLGGWY